MATQGILSITMYGEVVAKLVTGADGYYIPQMADDVKSKNITTAKELYELGKSYGLGGDSYLVQISPSEFIGTYEEDLTSLYSEKFYFPLFNPRWDKGTADYLIAVDMTPNV